MYLEAAVKNHAGCIRDNNEDNYYLCGEYRRDVSVDESAAQYSGFPVKTLFAVADGMGGELLGELASLLTVQELIPCGFGQIRETALASIQRANGRICAEIEKNGGRRIGSTLAALYIDDGKAVSCNVGDSRVYLLRGGKLIQCSVDHNRARSLVELGVLTPKQAAQHHSRHQLTQHLGIFEEEMHITPAFSDAMILQSGDIFLLCSDGLTDMVTDEEIAAQLLADIKPSRQAEALTGLAIRHGGRDNVTALVVRAAETKPSLFHKLFSFAKRPS